MRLKVTTANYANELASWADSIGASVFTESDGECFLEIEKSSSTAADLCNLMEDLILISNEVVKHSGEIKYRLKRIVFTYYEKDILKEIEDFLSVSDCINLEGFLNFRLSKYKELVDIILYVAIKKVLY